MSSWRTFSFMNGYEILGLDHKIEQKGDEAVIHAPSQQDVEKRIKFLRKQFHEDRFKKASPQDQAAAKSLLDLYLEVGSRLTHRGDQETHRRQVLQYAESHWKSGNSHDTEALKAKIQQLHFENMTLISRLKTAGGGNGGGNSQEINRLCEEIADLQMQLEAAKAIYAVALRDVLTLRQQLRDQRLTEYLKKGWQYRSKFPLAIFGFLLVISILYLVFAS